MPPNQIQLSVSDFHTNDFQQFLLHHQKIASHQKINNYFSISLKHQNQQEYSAFLQGLKEIFQIQNLKEIEFCQARCGDGSDCLNQARHREFCWKHQK